MRHQEVPALPTFAFAHVTTESLLTCEYLVTYSAGMDEVFRALGDPTRRDLLDRLLEKDGQTLQELTDRYSISRFGVMKHLQVLEEAGLVVTRRRGREKLHFLNPVPRSEERRVWKGGGS